MGDSESSYTQADRLLSIDTPLGKDVLLLQSLTGHEGISRLFTYDLDLLAYDNDSISFNDIVGQNVTITIQLPDGTPRYINGYVSRFAQGATDDRYFTHYTAEVVPWLWFLTRHADCRIFQNMTAPDIISQVFGLFSFSKFNQKLTGSYPTLEYCVQYRETAFNFVSRLMEEFGIFYYFDHSTQGQHTLVMADSSSALGACSSSPASYRTATGGVDDPSVVSAWHVEQELRTGKYTVTDYNFTTPSTSLLADEPTVVSVAPNSSLETFDYPGLHTTSDQGSTVAKTRMQEEEAGYMVATGSSSCRGFASGYTFELQNHDRADQNATYVLTEVQHVASVSESYTAGGEGTEHYSNHFTCIPSPVTYRPARLTPKPFVQGPQPALVVGKSGEEMWTDNYGRVKVQFYWDRLGKQDENSSCWIRVSHPWAGSGWGAIALPRIGQEVIVDFLEGDPDRPIIMGRVYNANQMPPYTLPDKQTQSGFKSRSSKDGSANNYNEIRFEDKKGNEDLLIHAESTMHNSVEASQFITVGSNRHITTGGIDKYGNKYGDVRELVFKYHNLHVRTDQRIKIEGDKSLQVGGNRMETVGGNDSRTVSGDVKEQVTGAMSLSVTGAQKEQINSDYSRTVGGSIKEQVASGFSQQVGQSSDVQTGMNYNLTAGMTINLEGGMSINIQAGEGICLSGPGGFVSIGPSGVTIQGIMVLINSGGAASPATSASPQSPDSPDNPDAPTDPTDPDTA